MTTTSSSHVIDLTARQLHSVGHCTGTACSHCSACGLGPQMQLFVLERDVLCWSCFVLASTDVSGGGH